MSPGIPAQFWKLVITSLIFSWKNSSIIQPHQRKTFCKQQPKTKNNFFQNTFSWVRLYTETKCFLFRNEPTLWSDGLLWNFYNFLSCIYSLIVPKIFLSTSLEGLTSKLIAVLINYFPKKIYTFCFLRLEMGIILRVS